MFCSASRVLFVGTKKKTENIEQFEFFLLLISIFLMPSCSSSVSFDLGCCYTRCDAFRALVTTWQLENLVIFYRTKGKNIFLSTCKRGRHTPAPANEHDEIFFSLSCVNLPAKIPQKLKTTQKRIFVSCSVRWCLRLFLPQITHTRVDSATHQAREHTMESEKRFFSASKYH